MQLAFDGLLQKMQVENTSPIQYNLKYKEQELALTGLVGKEIKIEFLHEIFCDCGKKVNKLYQGFCYDCFRSAPEASDCIIRPELCEAHLGKGRDVEWEERNHNQPHIVYLALSSSIKVGVTRETQVPTRWIDQGATAAIKLAEVPYRRLAGEIEVLLKDVMTDKTNWRKMLKNEVLDASLLSDKKEEVIDELPEIFHEFISDDDEVLELDYPVLEYPQKVASQKLDKTDAIEGVLKGIKGQYLIFDNGRVFNVRSHEGYSVKIYTI